jgi:hypothetical protein
VPILQNQRHELFAQELAKSKSAHEAYTLAGFKESRKNASRLKAKEDVAVRVAELQAVTARSAEITIKSICAELDQANQVAMERGQAAAMVSASALRAKLAGLLTDRIEIGGPGAFDQCDTPAEVIASMVAALRSEGVVLAEAQESELAALMTQMSELLAACRARPAWVIEANSPAEVRDRERRARNGRSLPPPRL